MLFLWAGEAGREGGTFRVQRFSSLVFHALHEGWIADHRRCGIDIGSRTITHFTWSDNILLLADTREKLRSVIQDVTNVIGAHGMRWKHSELFVLHIGDAKQMLEHDVVFVLENNERVRIPRVAQIQTLGAVLQQCGRMEGTVDEQLAKAKRSSFSGSHYLRYPRIVSPLKLARYKRDILTVAVSGCGAWTLSQFLLARLVCFENTVLR